MAQELWREIDVRNTCTESKLYAQYVTDHQPTSKVDKEAEAVAMNMMHYDPLMSLARSEHIAKNNWHD